MPRTAFLSTVCHVPARVVTNDDLAKIMDTSDEWIVQRTGIKTRYWVDKGDTGVALAREASKSARQGGARAGRHRLHHLLHLHARSLEPATASSCSASSASSDIPRRRPHQFAVGSSIGCPSADAWIRTGQYKNILWWAPRCIRRGLGQRRRAA